MHAKFRKLLAVAIALAGFAAIHPAQALTADGLTYTLTAFATPNPTVADLTLTISGINGSADTEGGRYGVFAIAFSDPSGFAQVTSVPTGFTPMAGGLGSGNGGGGCDGQSSGFYCVQNTQPITQATLAANSTLNFNFTVDLSGFNPAAAADYEDDFNISWDGSKSDDYGGAGFESGYDHASGNLTLSPAAAPEIDPGSASAALTLLAGGLAMLRGRRRKA